MQNDEVLIDVIRGGRVRAPVPAPRASTASTCATSGRWRPASCSTRARRRAPTRSSVPARSPDRSAPRRGREALGRPGALRRRRRRRPRGGAVRAPHRLPPRRLAAPRCASCGASRSTRTPEELETTERLLGRRPTDFTEFVRRVVAEHAEPSPAGERVTAVAAGPAHRHPTLRSADVVARRPLPHSREGAAARGVGRSGGCRSPRSRLGPNPSPPRTPGVRRGQHRSRRRPRDPRLARQPHRRGRGRPRRRHARAGGGSQRRVDRGLRGGRAT